MSQTDPRIRLLDHAIKLLHAGWAKYAFARDAKGKGVTADDPSACRFCAVGALHRAEYDLGLTYEDRYAVTMAINDIVPAIGVFNDKSPNVGRVIKLLERVRTTIALAT